MAVSASSSRRVHPAKHDARGCGDWCCSNAGNGRAGFDQGFAHSVLSLHIPSPHAALYDRGKFIAYTCSVPSPMTLAFAKSPLARHSQNSHHPFALGGWFRDFTGSLLATSCRVACSPTDLTGSFSQPTQTFTPELPTSRSTFSSPGITTVATERFHRWDFHPPERQLALLHGLFHSGAP